MRASDISVPSQEASEANWDAVLDTNLKAVFLLSKAVAPGMIAAPLRAHHQHRLARRQERLRGWRDLLRFEMGPAGPDGVHGRRPSPVRHSRQRDLARVGCHGFLAATGKDPRKMLQPEDVAHAVEMHPHAGAAKLYQRSAYPPHPEALTALRLPRQSLALARHPNLVNQEQNT